MATKTEQYQALWHRYDADRDHQPSSARQAVERAVRDGLLRLPRPVDPYDMLAAEMSQALRDEIRTDSQGRRYRVNHAVRVTKSGVQYTFWAIMGYAPHAHMEKAFAQRREQIIGDCVQLKTDIDVYNDMNQGKQAEIQLVLDFTEDVAERMVQRRAA
jgi:hypothetical protein